MVEVSPPIAVQSPPMVEVSPPIAVQSPPIVVVSPPMVEVSQPTAVQSPSYEQNEDKLSTGANYMPKNGRDKQTKLQ